MEDESDVRDVVHALDYILLAIIRATACISRPASRSGHT